MMMSPGFDTTEATALVSICSHVNGPNPPGTVPLKMPPVPEGWRQDYVSPVVGKLYNRFEIWTGPDQKAAIAFRGTVPEYESTLEDVLSGMIPAEGKMTLPSLGTEPIPYRLAANPQAAVHAGFTVGTLLLAPSMVEQIKRYMDRGITGFYITGHSQGAVLATLFRSYLAYAPVDGLAPQQMKVYVFAQASPGNARYAFDFEHLAANDGYAFRVINDQDWVPQMQLTVETFKNINSPNPLELIDAVLAGMPEWKKLLIKGALKIIDNELVGAQERLTVILGDIVKKLFEFELGADFKIPDFVDTMNYVCCGNPYVLKGVPGKNPIDPEDFMWQHHADMYYYLLTGKPVPERETGKSGRKTALA